MSKEFDPSIQTAVTGEQVLKPRPLLDKPSLYTLLERHDLTVDQLARAAFVGHHVIEALIWKIPASKCLIEGVLEGLYKLTRVRYTVDDVDIAIYEPESVRIYGGAARSLPGAGKSREASTEKPCSENQGNSKVSPSIS